MSDCRAFCSRTREAVTSPPARIRQRVTASPLTPWDLASAQPPLRTFPRSLVGSSVRARRRWCPVSHTTTPPSVPGTRQRPRGVRSASPPPPPSAAAEKDEVLEPRACPLAAGCALAGCAAAAWPSWTVEMAPRPGERTRRAELPESQTKTWPEGSSRRAVGDRRRGDRFTGRVSTSTTVLRWRNEEEEGEKGEKIGEVSRESSSARVVCARVFFFLRVVSMWAHMCGLRNVVRIEFYEARTPGKKKKKRAPQAHI